MEFAKLSEEDRRSFERDGFLIVRNALSPEAVENLTAAGDRLNRTFLDKPEIFDKPEYNHIDRRPGLFQEPAFVDLVASSPVVPYLVQLLSPNLHLHSTALIYKRPENPDAGSFRRGWHRDIRIPEDLGNQGLPRVGVKACFCLTGFHESACGMTLMARGTHLRDEPLVIPRDEVDPVGVEVCDLQLDAGDALLFENRIFHTAAPNRSDRTSKVVIYGYAYRWMKPEVYLAVPDPELLRRVDLVTRQLLGGYRDIDTKPWALTEWSRIHGVPPEPVPFEVAG